MHLHEVSPSQHARQQAIGVFDVGGYQRKLISSSERRFPSHTQLETGEPDCEVRGLLHAAEKERYVFYIYRARRGFSRLFVDTHFKI